MSDDRIDQICTLVGDTFRLTALHDQAGLDVHTTRKKGSNATRMRVTAADEDVPFLLGGRGSNVSGISELANVACPSGHWLKIFVKGRSMRTGRRPTTIPLASSLQEPLREEFIRVIAEWHELMTGKRPDVDHQATLSCDCFLVGTRSLPIQSLPSFRRLVGWAARVRGRVGFIEWIA